MERRTYTVCGTDDTVELTECDRLIRVLGDDVFDILDGNLTPKRRGIKRQKTAIGMTHSGAIENQGRVFWLNDDDTVKPVTTY